MKSLNLILKFTSKLSLLFVLLLISFQSYGQAGCPSITLKSQAEIDAFSCTSINGDLIIDNNSKSDIVSIDAIYILTTITGNVVIRNCHGLNNLQGLDGLNFIGGSLIIQNNANIVDLGVYPFLLTTIEKDLMISDCPKLSNLSQLNSLKEAGAINFSSNVGLSDFTNFNSVTQCPNINFGSTNIQTINGFNGLESSSWISFANNPKLVSISGFSNLSKMGPNGNLHLFQIFNNAKLSQINGFSNLTSITGIDFGIASNPLLSECCFALQMLDSNPASVTIGNNAGGCNSFGQIDSAPQLSACPPDRTVSTGAGNCTGITSATSPVASDNCDLASYNLSILSPNGSIQNASNIPSGVSLTYSNLMQGTTKITYIANDERGHSTNCSFNVVVEDLIKPSLSNIPPDVTIHCNDVFPTIPSPIIADNCDDNPILTAASSLAVGDCMLDEPAEIHSYSWTATDAFGNSTTAVWKVTVINDFSFDLGAPIEICDASSYIIDLGNIGNSYSWSTGAFSSAISVSNSGTYTVTVTTENGCCYVDEKVVTFSSPPVATATGATLECSAENVQIFGSSSGSNISYSWTGPGGFISNEQNPMVSAVGEYVLTVSNAAGCSSTASALVTGDNDIPNVTAEGGMIDCDVASVQLIGSSTTSNVTYSWEGPDGFTSNMQNPTVSVPGIYTLNVLSPNGCTASINATVEENTDPPSIDLNAGSLNCTQTEVTLSVEGSAVWTGPNGFTSNEDNIVVTAPGTYAVTVTGSNSCTNSESIEILSDISPPDISAEGGVLNCISGQTTLSGNSTSEDVSYSWTGPGEFTTEIQNPIAILPGTYTLTVIGNNGCTASMDVEVVADEDAPEVSVNDGSIDCINTSASLLATSPNDNVTFMWTGPNNYTEEGEQIVVMDPGEYTVVAINENGCTGSASALVEANNIDPTVSIFSAPIGCQSSDVTFITDASDNVTSYEWSGPNGFTSIEKEPVISSVGTYMVTVTADNGCTATNTFEVIKDSDVPDASATVEGLLTCSQNTITLMGSSTTDSVTYFWSGPDGFTSSLQTPTVSQPGEYIFYVIAQNGCTAESKVDVMGDGEFPTVSASGGKIDCNNNTVALSGTTNISDATFRWEGPNGFATSISNPEVSIAGEYTFTVTSPGGCVAFTTVTVTKDNQDPNLSLAQGFLNCDAGERSFRVVTNAVNPTVLWTGPEGYTSTALNAVYSKAGTYNLLVTGSNGCSAELSIEIEHDIPYVHTLNITDNNASLEIEGGTPPFVITWDNDILGSEVTNLPDGEHFVKIVDGLGCTKFVEFTINTSSTIDLESLANIKLFPNPVIENLNIEWSSDHFNAEQLNILDANGHELKRYSINGKNKQNLDLIDFVPGIYFVRLEGNNAVVYKKFLKM